MLYVGIDLHGKQMTVCARDEAGNVVLQRGKGQRGKGSHLSFGYHDAYKSLRFKT